MIAVQACLVAQGCRTSRGWQACVQLPPHLRRRWLAAAAAANGAASPAQQHHEQQSVPQQREQQDATQLDAQYAQQAASPLERLMRNPRLTKIAQEMWRQVIRPGDIVVDATCGNGHDAAFLAQAVGRGGTVHAFDVQPAAIEATRRLVCASLAADVAPELRCHLASHVEMEERVGCAECARLVVFNLGYLPGSDEAITTQESSTLPAVQAACKVLQPGGLCSILCYTGHAGGVEEYEAVRTLVGQLPPSAWVSTEVRLLNRPTAPVLLLVWKRKS